MHLTGLIGALEEPQRCHGGALEVPLWSLRFAWYLERCLRGASDVPQRCLRSAWEVPWTCLRGGLDVPCLRGASEEPGRRLRSTLEVF